MEENDEWEKKQARKARRADFSFNGEYPLYIGHPSQVNGQFGALFDCVTAQTMRTLRGESTRKT